MDRGWNVVERENEGHSQSQLYHEVSPASLAFSHQRYDRYPIFHPHLYNLRLFVCKDILSQTKCLSLCFSFIPKKKLMPINSSIEALLKFKIMGHMSKADKLMISD